MDHANYIKEITDTAVRNERDRLVSKYNSLLEAKQCAAPLLLSINDPHFLAINAPVLIEIDDLDALIDLTNAKIKFLDEYFSPEESST